MSLLQSIGNRLTGAKKYGLLAVGVACLSGATYLFTSPFGGKGNTASKPDVNLNSPINSPDSPGSIESIIRDFPERIPGAKSVDKYVIPGSRYCLVHIRQLHPANLAVFEQIEQFKDARSASVDIIQNNIYRIVSSLAQHQGLKQVYLEGVVSGQCQENNDLVAYQQGELIEMKHLEGVIQKLGRADTQRNQGERELRIVESAKKHMKEMEASIQRCYRDDGVLRAAVENHLTINGAEDQHLNEMATDDMEHLCIGTPRVFSHREDEVLRIIGSQNDPLAIVVFGASHSFGGKSSCGDNYRTASENEESPEDNIRKWNMAHPNSRMSLIEITPDGFEQVKLMDERQYQENAKQLIDSIDRTAKKYKGN